MGRGRKKREGDKFEGVFRSCERRGQESMACSGPVDVVAWNRNSLDQWIWARGDLERLEPAIDHAAHAT